MPGVSPSQTGGEMVRHVTLGQSMMRVWWVAGTPQQRDNGGIPANVFSMNLADRIKLSKGVRRLPVAYTMSGERCLSPCSLVGSCMGQPALRAAS